MRTGIRREWVSSRLGPSPEQIGDLFEFEWTEQGDEVLEEARLRLKRWPRLKFAYEAHLARNRKYFPNTSAQLGKMALALFSAILGGLIATIIG